MPIDKAVAPEGGPKVHLDRLDLGADSVRLLFSSEEPVDLRVFADADRLAPLEQEFDPETGSGKLTVYPAMRTHGSIRFEVRTQGRPRTGPVVVDVRLP